jgi:hypothetical protein
VTAAASTTVVTVTAPNTVVENGVTIKRKIDESLTPPKRIVRVAAHVVRALGVDRLRERVLIRRLLQRKVIIIVIHVHGCPPGTALYRNTCSPIVHGKG